MPEYKSPGVYIEEVDRGTKPIEAAGTSMTAFIGITAEASVKQIDPATGDRVPVKSVLNTPTLVTSWTQFVGTFGDFTPGAYLPDAVYGYFANGGGACYVVSLRALTEGASAIAAAAATIPTSGRGNSFKVSAKIPGPSTLSVTIASVGSATATPTEGTYELKGGGIPPLSADDFIGSAADRTGMGGLEPIDEVRLLVAPDVMAGYDSSDAAKERVKMIQEAMVTHCESLKYRFAVLDTPPGLNAQQAQDWRQYINFDTSYAALYYPWIRVADLSGGGSTSKLIPSSGHMAGIYNRTDAERGVHKAPANEIVRGAIDLELRLSKGEQDTLNPIGVNCIRTFPGRGIRVWGGRTLSSDGSWRYINVRRLFIMAEASMDTGLQWVVFEPNDRMLWARVRRDVSSFLRTVWLSGALFGSTPDEAFYVKCDDELNPPEIRDLGQLIIEVGMAPVKPAEFVIFRISQWAGPSAEA